MTVETGLGFGFGFFDDPLAKGKGRVLFCLAPGLLHHLFYPPSPLIGCCYTYINLRVLQN